MEISRKIFQNINLKSRFSTRGRHLVGIKFSIFGRGIGTGIDFWKPGFRFFLLDFIYFFVFFSKNIRFAEHFDTKFIQIG